MCACMGLASLLVDGLLGFGEVGHYSISGLQCWTTESYLN